MNIKVRLVQLFLSFFLMNEELRVSTCEFIRKKAMVLQFEGIGLLKIIQLTVNELSFVCLYVL